MIISASMASTMVRVPATSGMAMAMMAISLAWMSGTFASARMLPRVGTGRMLRVGTLVTTAGGLLSFLVPMLLGPGLALFFLPMAVVALGNGMGVPSVRTDTCEGFAGALERAFSEPGPHLVEALVPSVYSGLRLRAMPYGLKALEKLPRPVAKAVKKRLAP